MVTSEAEVWVYILSLGCHESCEYHVPCADVFRSTAFARWSAGYEQLIGLGTVILYIENCAVSCYETVSDTRRMKVVVLCVSLSWLCGHRSVSHEWAHVAAFNSLIGGMLIISEAHICGECGYIE